jgi:hypothetical protein
MQVIPHCECGGSDEKGGGCSLATLLQSVTQAMFGDDLDHRKALWDGGPLKVQRIARAVAALMYIDEVLAYAPHALTPRT